MADHAVGAPPPANAWRRFTAWYHRLLTHLVVVSVAILVFPVTLQVFARFIDWLPHWIWTEEMARFLFIWMIMIGAMVGVREGTHFEVDLFPILGARTGALVRLIGALSILIFAMVFLWAGWEFTTAAWYRISELAELPLWVIHIAWPLTGLTWIVFLGERVVDDLRILFGRAA